MAYALGPVVLLDESDMEAQLLQEVERSRQAPVTGAAERQGVSRSGIMTTLAVSAVLGYIACAHAGDWQMARAATQGFGSKFNERSQAAEERSQAAEELLKSVVGSARSRLSDAAGNLSGSLDSMELGLQAMSGLVGVLEEKSERGGATENRTFRWGVYDDQNKSSRVRGAVSDAKAILGALHDIRSQQGDADGGGFPAAGSPLAALGDGGLVQGHKGDELEDPSAAFLGMTGGLSAAAEAADKGAAGKDRDPLAALAAFTGAMAKQGEKGQKGNPPDEVRQANQLMSAMTGALSEAAAKADSGDAAGKDVDPFAPLAAFAGALAEQDGKIAGALKRCQNGDDCPEAAQALGA